MAESSEQNPWTKLSEQVVYDNPWIRVTEHQVLNAAGNPGIYGVVHFKNLAIGVVPYQDGHIWLVGQYRFPFDKYSWEIPEGGGRRDIDPLESAKRELKEETGLTAAHYEVILRMDLSNSVSDEEGIVYLATGLTHGEAEPEEDEDLALKRVPLEDVYDMVERGEITDSLTVGAIYKMMLMKQAGRL